MKAEKDLSSTNKTKITIPFSHETNNKDGILLVSLLFVLIENYFSL